MSGPFSSRHACVNARRESGARVHPNRFPPHRERPSARGVDFSPPPSSALLSARFTSSTRRHRDHVVIQMHCFSSECYFGSSRLEREARGGRDRGLTPGPRGFPVLRRGILNPAEDLIVTPGVGPRYDRALLLSPYEVGRPPRARTPTAPADDEGERRSEPAAPESHCGDPLPLRMPTRLS